MRGSRVLKNPIPFVALTVSICCLLVIMSSVLKLPEVSPRNKVIRSDTDSSNVAAVDEASIGGVFGEMMIEMLPQDLPFTLFVPSKRAFQRDLRLKVNASFVAEKDGDEYIILSRILGFSAVPRILSSTTMSSEKPVVAYDSLSGFTLHVSKDVDGMLIVNRIRCEKVDIRRGEILVHVIDGVVMDAEFEQSVQPDDDDA